MGLLRQGLPKALEELVRPVERCAGPVWQISSPVGKHVPRGRVEAEPVDPQPVRVFPGNRDDEVLERSVRRIECPGIHPGCVAVLLQRTGLLCIKNRKAFGLHSRNVL